MRLDLWLKENKKFSRKKAKQLIDAGKIYINGKKVHMAGWEVGAQDKVVVKQVQSPKGGYVKVIHEDQHIIVVDKPAGLLSVPDGPEGQESMLAWVQKYLQRKYAKKGAFVYPVHRLDAETSGVMVFALSNAGKKLEDIFKQHQINRRYLAIVEGQLLPESGRFQADLEKGDFKGGKKTKVAKSSTAKKAVTDYQVKEYYQNASLVELTVHTGRTHQIRVHLSEAGFPIIGDKVYGGKQTFARQALHAHALAFKHPVSNKKLKFDSPLPKDLEKLIDELRVSC
ncbi:MAG: RluA family pseudouridine synthase [Pseudomonadota bacterium]